MSGTETTEKSKLNPCTIFKCTYSTGLLIFCIVLIMALIFTDNTRIARDVHPALAFVLLWLAVIWLNMVEGGQASLVGLAPVNKDLYKESHPKTYQVTSLAHKGDNLDRYLMGRQFLALVCVFVTNLSGAPLAGAEILGLSEIVLKIFLGSGVAMILMTAMVGQLNSQVIASHCMLDYINNNFALFTLYVSLLIEASGLLHSCYLVQMIFAKLAGKPVVSNEPPRTAVQNLLFWGRVLMSLAILGFAFAVTLSALFNGQTTMWPSVPGGAAVVLFFLLMCVVGMLEGMQIAFFAVAKLSKEERAHHPMAMKTCELLFKGDGRNLPGFMVGRQICVTLCFFVIARVTTLDVDVDAGDPTVFGVSSGVQAFFNTGVLGAIITTIVASISWQLVASAFPVAFLSNPLVYVLLRLCLLLEATGICAGAWVLAWIQKRILGEKRDEVYIGTPEERAAKQKQQGGPPTESLNVEAGHLYPGVPTLPPNFGMHLTLAEITELQAEIAQQQQDLEQRQKYLETQRQKWINAESNTLNDEAASELDPEVGSDRVSDPDV